MKKIIFAIFIIYMGISFIQDTQAQQKYALLISTGETTVDDNDYHSEYWYDMFWMYRMLIDQGFTHNNIFVLYGIGADFNSAHAFYDPTTVYPGQQITDYAVSADNVDNIFNWLANGNAAEGIPQLQSNDFLFYWWMGHGNATTMDNYSADIATTAENVSEAEFETYFSRLPACQIKTEYVMTCHSGALTDDLESVHSMIHTAAEFNHVSFSAMYDVIHAELSYHTACAIEEQDPAGAAIASDTDGDGNLTIKEANDYVHTNTILSTSVIADYRNISPSIEVDDANPGSGILKTGIFSRDHNWDDGTVPSNNSTWYHGPDLWVRWFQDDNTTHQNPEFGQTNYVYARVHNIDCSELNGATVDFSWCTSSAWSNPASWNAIGTETVNNFLSSESRMINTAWNSVPAPGYYCLHTVLNVAGDAANADGRAYMDNNKVQINVLVEDNPWGWTVVYPFMIENGRDKFSNVDLVIDQKSIIESGAIVTFELPLELKLEKVEGGELKKLDLTTNFLLEKGVKRAALKSIPLEANEKKLVLMTLTLPKEKQKMATNKIKVSEVVDGKEVGGIIFVTNAASQDFVLQKEIIRIHNTFKMLNKIFGVKSAGQVAEFLNKFVPQERLSVLRNRPEKIDMGTLKELVELERMTLEEMERLLGENDFAKYKQAFKLTVEGIEKEDFAIIKEAQERLMYTTIPLFLSKGN